jgi:hypothetical protein
MPQSGRLPAKRGALFSLAVGTGHSAGFDVTRDLDRRGRIALIGISNR